MPKTKTKSKWLRVRFKTKEEDPRPVKWPVSGPYWLSGFGDDYNILIAYVPDLETLRDQWPEAYSLDAHEEESITYSSRFSKPSWWKGE